ncbi:hypothetical protein BBJ28_00011885 [Nothophytophthora sp. Chile5]|nr:hypothetical protein BBJ28_00011885 [Nothophytophthora sp. Chile5]
MELLARGVLAPRLRAGLRRPLPCLAHPLAAPPAWQLLRSRGLRHFPIKLLCRNQTFLRKAGSTFEMEREWNLGIMLQPSEVKSLRDRHADLSVAFGAFYKHELFLHQLHIPGRDAPVYSYLRGCMHVTLMVRADDHLWLTDAQIPMRIEVGETGWIKVIMAACYKRGQVDNRKRDDERDIKRQLRDW